VSLEQNRIRDKWRKAGILSIFAVAAEHARQARLKEGTNDIALLYDASDAKAIKCYPMKRMELLVAVVKYHPGVQRTVDMLGTQPPPGDIPIVVLAPSGVYPGLVTLDPNRTDGVLS
jgi:hypothetical protein